MRVEVTYEDVRYGHRYYGWSGPLVRAIRRATGRQVFLTTTHAVFDGGFRGRLSPAASRYEREERTDIGTFEVEVP